ncbi:MAG TPA: RimJ/RimL family protein N-acetyltransferase, partial [Mycobacterium sp.]|nr:RimJ/RimL family protein N-acetyltransferase [Mycobacterium sp.]
MNLWRSSSLHPGWPTPVGPLRVPAGVVRLRQVRLRDANQWSRIRLADRARLEPWEPATDVDWDVRHAIT